MTLTPDERRHCLDVLGWSYGGLAERLGVGRELARSWCRAGGRAPESVDAWLAAVAGCVERHPVPPKPERMEEEDG